MLDWGSYHGGAGGMDIVVKKALDLFERLKI